jgi:thiamine pyrophosphate-dependent acetolactate synthase large subunit-like protein
MTGDTSPPTRIGRDLLFDFMDHLHIDHLFGVPGTNEIPIIDGAFHHGVTYVPCLHENIALGAAMGWARMTGLPGVVELHVTPGIGHCIGNLFNAHKSHVPLVVFCGQQHSELLLQEPLIYLHNDAWEIGKNDYGEVAILGDIKETLRMLNEALDVIEKKDKEGFEAHAKVRKAALQVWLETNGPTTQESDAPAAGVITGTDVAKALRQLQDDRSAPGLVYVHEAMSDAAAFIKNLHYEHPTSYYCQEGGSLGWSMPASLGIQLALGHEGKFDLDRTVVNAVGDGSALFYPHVWWTAAKFALPVLYVIMNNREYKTLLVGLEQVKSMFSWPDAPVYPPYLRLDANAGDPVVDFVEVARSFGVGHGKRVESPASFETLVGELKAALDFVRNKRMPYVLELLTERFPEPGSAKALAGAANAKISPFLSVF